MALEYGGSGSGVPNPGVVDGSGGATLGGIIGSVFDGLSQAVQTALNDIGGLLGIPSANASSHSVVNQNGQSVGYLNLQGIAPGMSLAQALRQAGATIDQSGRVHDSTGNKAGFVDFDATTPETSRVGPVNVDDLTQTLTTVTQFGNAVTAQVPQTLALQLSGLDGLPVAPITRYWQPTICNTAGVPIVDYANCSNLFASPHTKAFMLPRLIMGKDGIYDIGTTQRLVPPANVGPAPQGFVVGPTAPYIEVDFAMGWTSAGRSFFWALSGDSFNVLDPTTGRAPVIVGYVEMKGWHGSQQISTKGASTDYPTAPNGSSPDYNTTVANVIAYSNVALNAAFLTYQAGTNPGGPEGVEGNG